MTWNVQGSGRLQRLYNLGICQGEFLMLDDQGRGQKRVYGEGGYPEDLGYDRGKS